MPSDPKNRINFRVVPIHQLKDFFHERSRARLSVSCWQHRYGMTHRLREQKGAYTRSRQRHYSTRGFAVVSKEDIPTSRYHGTFGWEGLKERGDTRGFWESMLRRALLAWSEGMFSHGDFVLWRTLFPEGIVRKALKDPLPRHVLLPIVSPTTFATTVQTIIPDRFHHLLSSPICPYQSNNPSCPPLYPTNITKPRPTLPHSHHQTQTKSPTPTTLHLTTKPTPYLSKDRKKALHHAVDPLRSLPVSSTTLKTRYPGRWLDDPNWQYSFRLTARTLSHQKQWQVLGGGSVVSTVGDAWAVGGAGIDIAHLLWGGEGGGGRGRGRGVGRGRGGGGGDLGGEMGWMVGFGRGEMSNDRWDLRTRE